MNSSVKNSMIIRPFSSQKGFKSLTICSLIGCLFAVIDLAIFLIAPSDDPKAHAMTIAFGIASVLTITLGIILYFVFPRVKIFFDASSQAAIIQTSANADTVIPFSRLQPFQLYEKYFGYAPQYYCRNVAFGEFSDLFFSIFHSTTLKKAQKLAALTGAPLIDYDRKRVA